jgi:DNA-binding beta-propeller fold protein YncE
VLIVSGLFSGGSTGAWAVAAKTGTFYGQAMTAGHIYLIAGGGAALGDGIPAVGAEMPDPVGLAVDHSGNVVIADKYQNPNQGFLGFRVRVVAVSKGTFYGQQMTAADIYTIAGGGSLHGSGHLATDTQLNAPWGVAISGSGNVLVSLGNTRLDVIAVKSGRFYGQRMTALHLYRIAGGGSGIVPDNRLATRIALLRPQGVAVDPAGDAIVSAIGENRVILVRA